MSSKTTVTTVTLRKKGLRTDTLASLRLVMPSSIRAEAMSKAVGTTWWVGVLA